MKLYLVEKRVRRTSKCRRYWKRWRPIENEPFWEKHTAKQVIIGLGEVRDVQYRVTTWKKER
jgi:hypothetical protein